MTGPLYQSVFCASGVVVFHLQEKSSQSDAAEASSENHQEEEEDVKPPAGETDASDEDEDKDEDEEFGSSDEEILTKSGKKLIFKSSRKNSFRRYCLSLRPMSGALIQLLILSAEVCFFYFPFPVRHAQRQGTTGEEEEGGRGGEEDSRVNSRVHVEGYMLTAIFVSRQQSRSMKTRRSTMTN